MNTKFTGTFPRDKTSWENAMKQHETVSVHDLQSANSASEITVEQFLSLKVLWPKLLSIRDLYSDEKASLFDSSQANIAAMKLNMEGTDRAWKEYLEAIERGVASRSSKFARELGVWALVLQSQAEAANVKESLNNSKNFRSTPHNTRSHAAGAKVDPKDKGKAKASSLEDQSSRHTSQTTQSSDRPANVSPMGREESLELPIGDEQIANTAAINFLNALFIHDVRHADWTLQRKQFKFNSKSVKFEARTDGHLEVHGQDRSAAILEVKPRVRQHEKGFRIEMQESGQMALWIFQEPNSHWAPRKGGSNFQ